MFRPYLKYALPSFYLIWLITYSIIGGTQILADDDLVPPGDFLATYTAIQIINSGNGQALYNFNLQKQVQTPLKEIILPPENLLPYISPPFFAFLFLPLANLSFSSAYFIVIGVNLVLLGITLQLLSKHLGGLSSISKGTLLLGTYSFFPYFVNLMQGQNAALTLLLLTGVFIALKQQQEVRAGILLGLTLYKPQLSLLFALYLLVKGRWQATLAFGATAFILAVISYLIVGQAGFIDYINLTVLESPLVDGVYGINYLGMHNWRSLFRLLLGSDSPNQVITFANWASLITLGILISQWPRHWQPAQIQFDLTFALILLATLLISPHLNTHDLTLWILVGLLIINYLQLHHPNKLRQPLMLSTIILAGVIPLITFLLGPLFHLQLTPLFMALVFLIVTYSPDYKTVTC